MAALISLGSAALAHADPVKTRAPAADAFTVRGDFNPQDNRFGPQGGRKSLQWDAEHGRWTLKLDMDQPVGRDVQWKDVQAGAYFRVTPQLRVGGAVGLGGDPENPINKSQVQPPAAARVRLETAFKF
ncbi:MAG: hypothetical protein JWP35_4776 [Caulobacter sp.]|nr:hypothetical protein [Caulobacter sp.]